MVPEQQANCFACDGLERAQLCLSLNEVKGEDSEPRSARFFRQEKYLWIKVPPRAPQENPLPKRRDFCYTRGITYKELLQWKWFLSQ